MEATLPRADRKRGTKKPAFSAGFESIRSKRNHQPTFWCV